MKRFAGSLAGLLLLSSGAALAQDEVVVPIAPQPVAPVPVVEPVAPLTIAPEPLPVPEGTVVVVKPFGMTVEVGGAVTGFVNGDARADSRTGAAWTARLTFGSRNHIGAEAAYVGSAQDLTALGVDSKALLVSNGVEGNLRLNLLTGIWQPYAIGGVGWQHYNVTNTHENTSSFNDHGDVLEFPIGVGLAYRNAGLVLDARVQYHPALPNNLEANLNLSTWDAGGRIGFEF